MAFAVEIIFFLVTSTLGENLPNHIALHHSGSLLQAEIGHLLFTFDRNEILTPISRTLRQVEDVISAKQEKFENENRDRHLSFLRVIRAELVSFYDTVLDLFAISEINSLETDRQRRFLNEILSGSSLVLAGYALWQVHKVDDKLSHQMNVQSGHIALLEHNLQKISDYVLRMREDNMNYFFDLMLEFRVREMERTVRKVQKILTEARHGKVANELIADETFKRGARELSVKAKRMGKSFDLKFVDLHALTVTCHQQNGLAHLLIQMPVVDAVYDLYEIKQNPICSIHENIERVTLNHTILERKFIASNSERGMFSLSTEEIAGCHLHKHGQYLCLNKQISFSEAYDCATQIFEKVIMKRNVTIDLCAFQIETRRSYVAIAAEKQGYLYTCLSKAIGYTLKCNNHEIRNLKLGAGEKLTHLAGNCSLEAQDFRMDGYYVVPPIRVTEFMHWPSENVTENLLTKLKKELLIKNNGALLHWIDGHEDEGDSKITIGDASWGLVASALLLVTGLIIAFVLRLKKQRKDSLGGQRIALKDRRVERRAKFTRSVSMNDITCPPGVIIV